LPGALLDSEILCVIKVPSRRVTNKFATISRFLNDAAAPEFLNLRRTRLRLPKFTSSRSRRNHFVKIIVKTIYDRSERQKNVLIPQLTNNYPLSPFFYPTYTSRGPNRPWGFGRHRNIWQIDLHLFFDHIMVILWFLTKWFSMKWVFFLNLR
jgi:hypothetical protein